MGWFALRRWSPAALLPLTLVLARPSAAQQPPAPAAPSASAAAGSPEERARAERPYWRQNLFVRILKDQKPLLLDWWPSEFRRPAFVVPLGAASLLAATSTRGPDGGLDVTWANHFDEWCSGSCNDVASNLTTLGNPPVVVAGLGITWLVSRWTHHDRLSEATSLSVEALGDTAIYNEALKLLFARVRPAGDSQGQFFNYGGAPEGQELGSFPSGHAQSAFTVAAVFTGVYEDHAWVPWVAYGTATLISASRVALHRHFPSDVIVGGLIGNSIGRFVVERSRGRSGARTFSSALLHLHPIADPDRQLYGIAWDGGW